MKLNAKEFKRFKELAAKVKAGKATQAEEKEFADLESKKNEKGSNDIKWWDNYPTLTDDVCKIPFNFIQGSSYEMRNPNNIGLTTYFGSVAKVGYVPSIGLSRSGSDAFNAQMRQLWLDMHRKYRGIGAYQRSDLGIMILAILGVFSTLAKFERIYSVINTYKIQNRNIPTTLYEALSIDPSVGNSLADFRYGLNFRISKLQQLCLPKGIAAIEAELVNNLFIFKDSENARAALFLFDSDVYAAYDPNLLASGGCVKYFKYTTSMSGTTPQGASAFTMNDMFSILDGQMNALLGDDDIAKMCSDLIAAYGPENVMTIGAVPESLLCEPIFDYERKLQFHNATFNGDVHSIYDYEVSAALAGSLESGGIPIVVYQHNDIIMNLLSGFPLGITGTYRDDGGRVAFCYSSDPFGAAGECGKSNEVLFDTWVEKPSKLEVMCGTRLTSCCDYITPLIESGTTYYYQGIAAHGTVVCTTLTVYTRNTTGGVANHVFFGSQVAVINVQANVPKYCFIQQLDWHPLLYIQLVGGQQGLIGDVDNCTLLTRENLSKIHDVALYSAFKIPNVSYIS